MFVSEIHVIQESEKIASYSIGISLGLEYYNMNKICNIYYDVSYWSNI